MTTLMDGRRRFEDRVCVVTGGASGIGQATCRALAAEGGRVGSLDLVEHEPPAGGRAYACDVADPAAVAEAFARVDSALGPVDVLVTCAGNAVRRQDVQERLLERITGGPRASLRATSTLDDESWDRTIRVHLYGTFHCVREALRRMEPRGSGAIVTFSSTLGVWGSSALPEYGAAKGAIAALTKGLAQEVGPGGIRVNAVAPGSVATPFLERNFDPRLEAATQTGAPLGPAATPAVIAALVLHLASDEAAYTTGQVISPNGGTNT